MPYRITGTLKLPSGVVAAGVDIKFKALKTFSPLIEQAEIVIRTDAAGKYDVTLEFNAYLCEVTFSTNRPFNAGQFTVASDTVVGKDLPTLLNSGGWQPATPEWIIQIQTWLAEANASAAAADTSAKAAKVSETNSKASETSASSSASSALSSKNASKTSEANAATSASQASASASQASTSANRASTSETNAATSASAAAQSQTLAKTSETTAVAAADRAEQAAQTVVGALVDGGAYNPSSGQLPTPVTSGSKKLSTIWKVTGTGIVGGIDLGNGDSLIYTSRDDSYYKIDNTESVSKVNNKTGVVVLTATDVDAVPIDKCRSAALENSGQYLHSGPIDFDALEAGFNGLVSTKIALNAPPLVACSGGFVHVEVQKTYSADIVQTTIPFRDAKAVAFRTKRNDVWGPWIISYTAANKPTANEVGADPSGTASTAITAHEAKANAHPISGVSGLQAALDAKPSRNILINGEVTRINQRGFDGNWANLAVGAYGYDRWKKSDATNMTQVVEAGNFTSGAKYRLSGTGVTAATLTAPASGDWTITVPQAARNVQLELGELSTQFEVRNIQQELAMCQRYYWRMPFIFNFFKRLSWNSAVLLFPVEMRANPSATLLGNRTTHGDMTGAVLVITTNCAYYSTDNGVEGATEARFEFSAEI